MNFPQVIEHAPSGYIKQRWRKIDNQERKQILYIKDSRNNSVCQRLMKYVEISHSKE